MSQIMPLDLEVGGRTGGPDDRRSHPTTMRNHPFQGESNFVDSSGPLFTIYSKAAEDEDNKMVERWQKDADSILIFSGLFSAAVAVLLAVTVQDLRPNSQDTSAFYLGNIYQVLADPNAIRPSTPSPVVIPPSFSPSRYAVRVNTLWFLSLVTSLSCALWAISLQQWARQYLRRVQPALCISEKRARMRAFFAEGVDKMHIPWAVEGLPMLLHLSLFLFFGGLAVFLFNVNHEVFSYVICWIGLLTVVYGLITLLPIIRHDSPYHSPLSSLAWFLYAGILHVIFKILAFIAYRSSWTYQTWRRCKDLRDRYRRWMLGGVKKAAEETASERSSEIDIQILNRTISALGDDVSPKSFFKAIPGIFNSNLMNSLERDFPVEPLKKFTGVLGGFLSRTWSSNSVDDSEKVRRLGISLNAIDQFRNPPNRLILYDILFILRDVVPQTVAMGDTLARWFANNDQDIPEIAQRLITGILVGVRERNDSWVTLASQVYGLPEGDITFGSDSLSLAMLIHFPRQYLYSNWGVLATLTKLDIRNTLPRLQHDFCALWNEIVQDARNRRPYSDPVYILIEIRHLYIALHEGTNAAPTAFSSFTYWLDEVLYEPSSYPLCDLAIHRPDSTPHVPLLLPIQTRNSLDAPFPPPTDGGNTASRQAKKLEVKNATASDIGPTSHGPDATPPANPTHFSSRLTGASPTIVVVAAPQDIASTATVSHPLEGSGQQVLHMVAPSAGPGTSQILSTASSHAPTPILAPIPTSHPYTPSESYGAGVATVPNPSHFVPPSPFGY